MGAKLYTSYLVKHNIDLLDRQSSEWGKDEVLYFYDGDVFCIHLVTKYVDFQEKKNLREDFFLKIGKHKGQGIYKILP